KGLIEDQNKLEELRIAADVVTHKTRNQTWPYKRTVGKQFPPWNDESPDVWGVQHIMHQSLNQRSFSELYFSKPMVDLTAKLSDRVDHNQSMIGLLNLLVEPQSHQFELGWHRDSIKADASHEEEVQKLIKERSRSGGVQWNLALYEDSCLFAIPGSHRRPRTDVEREIMLNSKGMNSQASKVMPGQVCVTIMPGEGVFYDSEIIHRARYDPSFKRRTLHGVHLDRRIDPTRPNRILQHFSNSGFYYDDDEFLHSLPNDAVAKGMVDRMIQWTNIAKKAGLDEFVQENI
ncbi:hypothetical protein PPACK8108_LOCUS20675, partial [Phakopsora pachyrhizi]